MDEPELHLIAEDLRTAALDEWVDEGQRALEAYLEKHAAFTTYLERED